MPAGDYGAGELQSAHDHAGNGDHRFICPGSRRKLKRNMLRRLTTSGWREERKINGAPRLGFSAGD